MSISRIASSLRNTLAVIAILSIAVFFSLELVGKPSDPLPNPPELRAKNHILSLTLRASTTTDRKDSFYFNGQPNAPTLRLAPGDQLKITYINDLPSPLHEKCLIDPCMDKDHLPGLYWCHTHPHGESYQQALDGISGALVIEGIESYVAALVALPERVLVIRGRSIKNDEQSAELKQRVNLSSDVCGGEPEPPEEVMTVNGWLRPKIEIAPGERRFWRVVNASADRYVDLQLEGETFEIVVLDGMPIARHDVEMAKTRLNAFNCVQSKRA